MNSRWAQILGVVAVAALLIGLTTLVESGFGPGTGLLVTLAFAVFLHFVVAPRMRRQEAQRQEPHPPPRIARLLPRVLVVALVLVFAVTKLTS